MSDDSGVYVFHINNEANVSFAVIRIHAFDNLTANNFHDNIRFATHFNDEKEAIENAKAVEAKNPTEYGVLVCKDFANVPRTDMYLIYSKPDCVFCTKAKEVFVTKNLSYKEIVVGQEMNRDTFIAKFPNQKTLPLIFKDDQMIGGLSQLVDHLNSEK